MSYIAIDHIYCYIHIAYIPNIIIVDIFTIKNIGIYYKFSITNTTYFIIERPS